LPARANTPVTGGGVFTCAQFGGAAGGTRVASPRFGYIIAAMPVQATYDDANLILRLFELRREAKMREARAWFVANVSASTLEEVQKIAPMGSQENAYLRMVTSYWDMACSFVTSGVLNQELFFQSAGEMVYVWERIRLFVPALRAAFNNPKMYANLEAVATAYIKWMEASAPGWYEGFSAQIRGAATAGKS
jgi:hypothetical protein